MLDTIFRNGSDRKQTQDELRTLLVEARSERIALRAMLDQAGDASARLAQAQLAIDELGGKTDAVKRQVEALSTQATRHDERERRFEALEAQVGELIGQMAEIHRMSQALVASGSDLRQHQLVSKELGTQALQARAALDALRQENERLEQMRQRLGQSALEVEASVQGVARLKGELQDLQGAEAELRVQMQAVRELARGAQGDSAHAAQLAREVDSKIETFTQLQELSKGTEARLSSLNALAEHVSHKARALETQKHTVEHAVVEAARLNEMVWAMDAQIAKIAEGKEQLLRTEETVARMAQLASSTAQELAAAAAAREASLRETARLQAQGRTLTETLRTTVERLSLDKQEFDAFDQRLKTMSTTVAETEARMHSVLARDEAFAALQRQAEALAKSFDGLAVQADALARKQVGLDALAGQLGQIDALGARTAAQQQSLLQSQQDLDRVRHDLAEFHTAYAEAAQLRDKLALDRSALESFAERTASMLGQTPEVQARLDAVLEKMTQVDRGSQAAEHLAQVATALDQQLTRVSARMQFVELLDERVNGLHELTAQVERRHAEQLARRAEVEGLKNQCDTLGALVLDTQHKLEGVAALQARLLPLTEQVSSLTQTLQTSQQQLQTLKQDDAVVREQQARLAELAEQSRLLGTQTAARLELVRAANDDLGRAGALKETLLAELAQVQARQREALAQIDVADGQLQRAEAMTRQLEQRRTQLQVTEQAIAGFEGRLAELDRGSQRVDQKIQSLAEREALVQAVKAEVDNIRQISSRSRADLQFVTDHRGDVTDLRARIEDLMGRASETDQKIETIEARRKTVDEVQATSSTVVGMLGDIQLNLEMLSEQRAVIDHVGDQLARLDFTVQEAQNTLRALQREREVAERIEQGIKALRARSGAGA